MIKQKDNKVKSFCARILKYYATLKKHPVYLLIMLIITVIIGLGALTDSIDKIGNFIDKYFYSLSSPKQIIATENIANSDTSKLVKLINRLGDGTPSIYQAIHKFYKAHNQNGVCFEDAENMSDAVQAQILGNVAIINSYNQYNSTGFIIYINLKTNKVILCDNDLGLGITGFKVINNPQKQGTFFIAAKYQSSGGTGSYANSVKFFYLFNETVIQVLDIPYSEVNSGWGAFKAESVSFDSKNTFRQRDGKLELLTTGIVSLEYSEAEDKPSEYILLPEQVYQWEPENYEFLQIKGRVADTLMTSTYGDLASPKGKWFIMPKILKAGEKNPIFSKEVWD